MNQAGARNPPERANAVQLSVEACSPSSPRRRGPSGFNGANAPKTLGCELALALRAVLPTSNALWALFHLRGNDDLGLTERH